MYKSSIFFVILLCSTIFSLNYWSINHSFRSASYRSSQFPSVYADSGCLDDPSCSNDPSSESASPNDGASDTVDSNTGTSDSGAGTGTGGSTSGPPDGCDLSSANPAPGCVDIEPGSGDSGGGTDGGNLPNCTSSTQENCCDTGPSGTGTCGGESPCQSGNDGSTLLLPDFIQGAFGKKTKTHPCKTPSPKGDPGNGGIGGDPGNGGIGGDPGNGGIPGSAQGGNGGTSGNTGSANGCGSGAGAGGGSPGCQEPPQRDDCPGQGGGFVLNLGPILQGAFGACNGGLTPLTTALISGDFQIPADGLAGTVPGEGLTNSAPLTTPKDTVQRTEIQGSLQNFVAYGANEAGLQGKELCYDSIDNDHNGLVDKDDPLCSSNLPEQKFTNLLQGNESKTSRITLHDYQISKLSGNMSEINATAFGNQLAFLKINATNQTLSTRTS